jgi:hypothetical protein
MLLTGRGLTSDSMRLLGSLGLWGSSCMTYNKV